MLEILRRQLIAGIIFIAFISGNAAIGMFDFGKKFPDKLPLDMQSQIISLTGDLTEFGQTNKQNYEALKEFEKKNQKAILLSMNGMSKSMPMLYTLPVCSLNRSFYKEKPYSFFGSIENCIRKFCCFPTQKEITTSDIRFLIDEGQIKEQYNLSDAEYQQILLRTIKSEKRQGYVVADKDSIAKCVLLPLVSSLVLCKNEQDFLNLLESKKSNLIKSASTLVGRPVKEIENDRNLLIFIAHDLALDCKFTLKTLVKYFQGDENREKYLKTLLTIEKNMHENNVAWKHAFLNNGNGNPAEQFYQSLHFAHQHKNKKAFEALIITDPYDCIKNSDYLNHSPQQEQTILDRMFKEKFDEDYIQMCTDNGVKTALELRIENKIDEHYCGMGT